MSEKEITSTKPTGKYTYSKGNRKTAIAKVRLYKGEGKITVNGKEAKEYFNVKTLLEKIKAPLKLTGTVKEFDISIMVEGGGISAQAEAAVHGISRALVETSSDNRTTLKKAGMLTRDARSKERKKYGLKRARKAPQFSKR
ncbi:30S ribosomal protein S9 [Candidatus Peregrinibacteria bacterium HGW-Peregrinibacteria-1]|jgi:small subunit ribosomal protein S9|nr:MAG: 30S ribosomal protein S9 [Candidatus Peregrinibacteria bacterium HGW-Peregrinibacteria-1]